jgi:thiaminase
LRENQQFATHRIAPAPVTHGYTRHLLTVAYGGSIADIVAAVLPCQLGYEEIGTALAGEGRSGVLCQLGL